MYVLYHFKSTFAYTIISSTQIYTHKCGIWICEVLFYINIRLGLCQLTHSYMK